MVLRWRVHLAKEQPQKLIGVIAVVLVMAVLGYTWFGSPLAAGVVVLALLGALSDFLLPITCTLTSSHALTTTLAGRQAIAWKDVRTCYLDEHGIKLSPLSKRSRLEAYRGVYLRFGDRREEVIEAVAGLKQQDG